MGLKKYALIMAGGEGRRAGTDLPKQFVKLLGIPMLWWSVMAFHKEDPETEIKIILHPGFFDDWDILREEIPAELRDIKTDIRCGGRTRAESVRNGLMSVPDKADALVAVHDAARPLITPELVATAWQMAEQYGASVPVVPVTDSLRELSGDSSHAVDRNRFVAVQTPQTARADILHKAYRLDERPEFTDDASRIEALGINVKLFEGLPFNLKVTNPTDFAIAETLLKLRK